MMVCAYDLLDIQLTGLAEEEHEVKRTFAVC